MPRFSIIRARKFIELALDAPLFKHIGEPFECETVIRANSLPQYERAMKSGRNLSHNTLNHHTARIIDTYGMNWFQEHNNECVELIWDEVDKTPFKRRMNAAWKRVGIPEVIEPFIFTKTWAYNFFSGLAFDHALGLDLDISFKRRFIEPWLLNGHLPCGWKGKVPREPKAPPGQLPWTGVSLIDAIGDGKLVVF